MGFPRGMRRDRVELEQRRMTAARLLERGQSEAEVARRLGVSRQSVNRWAQTLATAGRAGLQRAARAGAAAQAQRNRAATPRALSAAGS